MNEAFEVLAPFLPSSIERIRCDMLKASGIGTTPTSLKRLTCQMSAKEFEKMQKETFSTAQLVPSLSVDTGRSMQRVDVETTI